MERHAYDLVIRGGTIVDGTGAPRFIGEVAVKDGLLRQYDMTGPVKVSTASGAAKYDGTGTATISRKRTPN